MKLGELSGRPGGKRDRKRVGRGHGTGSGKTSGRGQKGQRSRSGGNVRPGFEGGQTPLHMRTPKLRGNTKKRSRDIGIFRRDYAIVNVGTLAALPAGSEVSLESLAEAGMVKRAKDGLRVLGGGELAVALTVTARHFTAAARTKIEAAGGTATLME